MVGDSNVLNGLANNNLVQGNKNRLQQTASFNQVVGTSNSVQVRAHARARADGAVAHLALTHQAAAVQRNPQFNRWRLRRDPEPGVK